MADILLSIAHVVAAVVLGAASVIAAVVAYVVTREGVTIIATNTDAPAEPGMESCA